MTRKFRIIKIPFKLLWVIPCEKFIVQEERDYLTIKEWKNMKGKNEFYSIENAEMALHRYICSLQPQKTIVEREYLFEV